MRPPYGIFFFHAYHAIWEFTARFFFHVWEEGYTLFLFLEQIYTIFSTKAGFRPSSTDNRAFVALLADLSSSQIFHWRHRSSYISTAFNSSPVSVSRSPEFALHYRAAVTMVTACLFNLITWHRKQPKASMSIDVAQPSPKPRRKPTSSSPDISRQVRVEYPWS